MCTKYCIVRKNIDGIYLKDNRNDQLFTSLNKDVAYKVYDSFILNKHSCNEKYVLFKETDGSKYLEIIIER